MTILTRIKNNQVTDNTIEYQKLKDGTLVGSKFNANLTLNSNVTILGNLTVANSFAQLNSINTYINDPIVVFNNNYSGSPSYDIGMLINRNLSSLAPWGSVNAAWVWKEASAAFEGIMTTETGTTTGAINRTGFANLFIGNIGANTLVIRDTTTSLDYQSGALVVAGAVGIAGNVNINSTTRIASNVVAHSGVQSTNTTSGALVVVGGAGISANLNVGGSFNLTGNALITGNLTVLGASTTIGTADLTVQDAVINLHTTANLAAWTIDDGKDIGIKFHYYDGVDGHAFLGRSNSTRFLEFYGAGTEAGNVFTGTALGTIKSGEFFSANTTNSTSAATGAIRTSGGLGVVGNVFTGNSATFNTSKTPNQNFVVKGANDETLLWARSSSTYDSVIIGNSATPSTLVTGAKLIVNSTASMIIPNGTTAQRPSSTGGTDVVGMFRYNTSQLNLEIFNGTQWDAVGSAFTVITDEQFNGDGTTTAFTLAAASTTASTIVSINGVLQIPTIAYSVTSATLTFTEAPAVGDLIDVRRLATTSVITNIASTNGYMQVIAQNSGVFIYSGTNSTSATTQWDTSGAEVNIRANTSIVIDNADTVIDYFFANTYSSAEYTVTSTIRNTNIREIAKILLVHNGSTVEHTTYGAICTAGNTLTNFEANIVSGNLKLYANTTNGNTIIRVDSVYQAI